MKGLGEGGNACRFLDSVDAPFGTVSSKESSRATIANYSRLTSVGKTVIDHDDEAEAPRGDGSCVRAHFSGGLREWQNNTKEPRVSIKDGRDRRPKSRAIKREGFLAPPLGSSSFPSRASRSNIPSDRTIEAFKRLSRDGGIPFTASRIV